jgi:signal transduction histidine kinase
MTGPSGQNVTSRRETYAEQVRRTFAWLRNHPREADVALAALVLLGSAGQTTGDPYIVAVSLVLAATVAVRRTYPAPAFAVAAVIAVIQIDLGLRPQGGYYLGAWQPTASDAALLVLLYSLAAYRSRRVSAAGLLTCLALVAAAIVRWAPASQPHGRGDLFGAALGLGGLVVTAWVLGDSVAYRHRVARLAALEEQAARLEAERDAQARIAAAAERARELQERRARAVDESAARLRRIERDLHDGAQVRLAALALTLGELKESLAAADARVGEGAAAEAAAGGDEERGRIRMLVTAAHSNAKQTLTELRDLARGIHPAVLDRGLGPALSVLAETSATPVELSVSIQQRPSPAIEAMAYFCTAELLANVAKHSGASQATIVVTDHDGELQMTVTDNGSGGARIAAGGGLAGLLERVQTVDGRLTADSPPGGPTVISIVLPGHV